MTNPIPVSPKVDVPTKRQARHIARRLLRDLATTNTIAFILPDLWIFAADAPHDHHVECECKRCVAGRAIDRPIMSAITAAIVKDQDVLTHIARHVVDAASNAAELMAIVDKKKKNRRPQ